MTVAKEVSIGPLKVGGQQPHFLIAGPCVIENERLALETAEGIAQVTQELGIPYIYKSSYDKANRTSISSFRGLGQEKGLAILKKVKDSMKIPILTDIHAIHEVSKAAEIVDVLQIPAFLCRQTDLLVEAAKTGCVVNVKKGQF
ncbi:MAG: 3-deoxy-8-phosphooctulonate synthase, partial [Nitrospira sp.]|nr:3-deoxy-8-phosphooctulonate synthase [Nitrospira sp.]